MNAKAKSEWTLIYSDFYLQIYIKMLSKFQHAKQENSKHKSACCLLPLSVHDFVKFNKSKKSRLLKPEFYRHFLQKLFFQQPNSALLCCRLGGM